METIIRSCESEASQKGRAQETELWQKLQQFDLDGDAPFSFSRRLARDNAWDSGFAMRVVEEYKKFLFLAVEAGHPVSPSDEVDQAWHLHLCYTRSYWDELCAQVLERPLHHGPTRGGAQEGAKFHDWYARTLDSYRAHFGCEPPSDIWPPASIRFGPASQWRRVSTQSHWVLKKPALLQRLPSLPTLSTAHPSVPFAPPLALASGLLLVCVALFIGGDASEAVAQGLGSLNIFNWDGASFLALFWSLCLIGAIAVFSVRNSFALPDDQSFPSPELDAYQIARLGDTGDLPTDAALASLQQARKIHIERNGRISRWDDAPPFHAWEREVWNAIAAGQSSLVGQTLGDVRSRMRPRLALLDSGLQQAGLLIEPSLMARVQSISLSIPSALLVIGLVKIAIGAWRGKPIGFLSLSCLGLLVAMILVLSNRPRRSKRGHAYLEHLRARYTRHDLRAQAATAGGAVAFSLALWGYSELDALGMAEARAAMRPVSSGDSGGGGSSGGSDGGSSDGGGGGGDGGGGGCGGGGCGGCGGG